MVFETGTQIRYYNSKILAGNIIVDVLSHWCFSINVPKQSMF